MKIFAVCLALASLAGNAAQAREVTVSNVPELQSAIAAALPGDDILVAPGTYSLPSPLFCTTPGEDGNPITVRGEAPGVAVLKVNNTMAFEVSAPYWTFRDLEIHGSCASDSLCEHAFHIIGQADHTTVRNCVMRDFNAQIKGNGLDVGGTMIFPDDVVIENSEMFNITARSTGNPVTPIDVVGGKRWIVRANFIHDFEKGGSDKVSYAAFFKGNSRDGVFERNLVVCEWLHSGGIRLGLSFGGGGSNPDAICEDGTCAVEHTDGTMRNNIIVHCPRDVGIYLNEASGAKVYNNILYDTKGIDARFTPTTADIRNNILSGEIRERDGGTATTGSNLTNVPADQWYAWFTDPDNLDFTLLDGTAYVDQGESLTLVTDDFCTNDRNDGATDIGPVEYDGDSVCDTTFPYQVGDEDPAPSCRTVAHDPITAGSCLLGLGLLRRRSKRQMAKRSQTRRGHTG